MPERLLPEPLLLGDEAFADGNMAGVIRLGNEVRRGRTPWSEASHSVLRHLESVGFAASPRFLGSDGLIDRYSYIPGETAPADLERYGADSVLIEVGQLVLRYHDAMAGFQPSSNVRWPIMPRTPSSDGTICHNDIAPWNVVFREGRVAGLIDWDLASPATRAWDLAYAAWRFAPLYPGEMYGTTRDRVRRVHLLLDAYGMARGERTDFPETILARMRSAYDTVERWGANGVPGFERLYREKLHTDALDHMAWLAAEFEPMW